MALETLACELPDLITLDINMPRMSGADVLTQIRTYEHIRRLPVIILSSREELPAKVAAQANAVMLKPFDITALLAATAELLALAPPHERVVGE